MKIKLIQLELLVMINAFKSAIFSVALIASSVVSAQTFNFTTLTPTGITGCGFNSGNDRCGTSLTFTQGLLTATASATYNNLSSNGNVPVKVVQDWNGTTAVPYVGLGVYHRINDTSDDNVTLGELLTLTFNQVVTLTGLNLRAEGHGTNFGSTPDTFLLNGTSRTLTSTIENLSLTGKSFTFGYGNGNTADQYYLSGMTVTAVPEPETFAMMLAGLALMGTITRRRKVHK
jgi:hypothetical protein